MAIFSVAGEGILDLAVARKMLSRYGHQVASEFDKGGKHRLDAAIPGYLNAARFSPWLILRDLDDDGCPVALLNQIAPNRHEIGGALIRLCNRSVESWLLADRSGFARFFGLALAIVPANPDLLVDPKQVLIQCVSASRHRNLREGVIPRPGSGRKVGPEYNAVLSDFVNEIWDVDRGCDQSNSLSRASGRIANFDA
ncbi:hypothetical protein [Sphingomonas sp. IBVSS2]|uniref:hypothetical protein n=1 Tax=Sphingomonas sp. IBVSS2 TaxID=1985172 RepID=UPI0015C51B6F|nr:hypothetical protein [Sphingomonas sp. IBVSS2]